MRKIDRSAVAEPACLAEHNYKTQEWSNLCSSCKRKVRLALQSIQGKDSRTDESDDEAEFIDGLCCAYCEARIFHGGHIEHFRRKHPDHFPELTFSWPNLFLACSSKDHCGHFKDRRDAPQYNPNDLIKPDEEDPDEYLYFHSTGKVRAREGIDAAKRHRADETIRVFNLDCGELQGLRERELKLYKQRNTGIMEFLMDLPEPERLDYIQMEMEATRWSPFSAVIRHFFLKIT